MKMSKIKRKDLVFISSTYDDLIDERKNVSFGLLKNSCIPAGMELFGARSESTWEVIKNTILESDFYVLIVKGMYGSIDKKSKENLSFTEEEYNYAKKINKPILSFIYEDRQKLRNEEIEQDPSSKVKLDNFIKKIEDDSVAGYWTNSDQLVSIINTAIRDKISASAENIPQGGWLSLSNTGPLEDCNLVVTIMQKEILQLIHEENPTHEVVQRFANTVMAQLANLKEGKIFVPTNVLYEQILNVVKNKKNHNYLIVDHLIFRWHELIDAEDNIPFNTFSYTNDIMLESLERLNNQNDEFNMKRIFYINSDHMKNYSEIIIKILKQFHETCAEMFSSKYETKVLVYKKSRVPISKLRVATEKLFRSKDVVVVSKNKDSSLYSVYKEHLQCTSSIINMKANQSKSSIEVMSEEDGNDFKEKFELVFDNAYTLEDFFKEYKK